MKRVIAILSVAAAFVMLNGCSKCSQERPAEPPPVMEAPPAAPADPAAPPPVDPAMPPTPPPTEGGGDHK